jgi:hypothetical protein
MKHELLQGTKKGKIRSRRTFFFFPSPHLFRSAGCGWWLVLVCYERKLLLNGWWLVSGAGLM